jgi:hypothetical protein
VIVLCVVTTKYIDILTKGRPPEADILEYIAATERWLRYITGDLRL